jgi:hypothetical protein
VTIKICKSTWSAGACGCWYCAPYATNKRSGIAVFCSFPKIDVSGIAEDAGDAVYRNGAGGAETGNPAAEEEEEEFTQTVIQKHSIKTAAAAAKKKKKKKNWGLL